MRRVALMMVVIAAIVTSAACRECVDCGEEEICSWNASLDEQEELGCECPWNVDCPEFLLVECEPVGDLYSCEYVYQPGGQIVLDTLDAWELYDLEGSCCQSLIVHGRYTP